MMDVSRSSVQRATIVRDHGTPEEKAAVKQGEQSVRHLADKINKRKTSQARAAPNLKGRKRRRHSSKRPAPSSR